jgi:protein gp37
MSDKSRIEWTDATWNPVTGCSKVSAGCANCYAETFSERWRGIPGHPYEQGFDLKLWPDRLNLPSSWREPRRIFVNSMSDLFHKKVPDEFVCQVFDSMTLASQHEFQLLTKRSERLLEWTREKYGTSKKPILPWPKNVWIGVSVENEKVIGRIDDLVQTPALVKFLSIEPLIGPIKIERTLLKKISWVIVGGESGPGARPMDPAWAREIRDDCRAADVPFFFKQWGAFNSKGERVGKKYAGRRLDGRTWNQFPASLEPPLAMV